MIWYFDPLVAGKTIESPKSYRFAGWNCDVDVRTNGAQDVFGHGTLVPFSMSWGRMCMLSE
jgi:hypothetical protein